MCQAAPNRVAPTQRGHQAGNVLWDVPDVLLGVALVETNLTDAALARRHYRGPLGKEADRVARRDGMRRGVEQVLPVLCPVLEFSRPGAGRRRRCDRLAGESAVRTCCGARNDECLCLTAHLLRTRIDHRRGPNPLHTHPDTGTGGSRGGQPATAAATCRLRPPFGQRSPCRALGPATQFETTRGRRRRRCVGQRADTARASSTARPVPRGQTAVVGRLVDLLGFRFWVTIVGITFPDSSGALAWCRVQGFDADHCAAKVVSTSMPIEGSTAYN
jgi:hypothetical protein